MIRIVPALALVLSTLAAPALAQGAGPTVTNIPPTNPVAAAQWSDTIAQMASVPPGNAPPNVFVIEGTDKWGRRVTFSQFQSLFTCGASNCQARLFVDGQLDREVSTCQGPDGVQLAPNGTYVMACGATIDFTPPNPLPR